MNQRTKPTALEFFAGGGLARLGLSTQFDVLWANDIDPVKASAWTANFGASRFKLGDVADIDPDQVPHADLAWASFPCQDLSLAGTRAGLGGARSSAFFGFMKIIQGLQARACAPKVLVIENVCGLLTSHKGQDFVALMQAISDLGYRAGVLEIDARFFVPQSRPRVFIVACAADYEVPVVLHTHGPALSPFTTAAIIKAWQKLPDHLRQHYVWWTLSPPSLVAMHVSDVIDASDRNWWPDAKTQALVDSFSVNNRAKLAAVQATATPHIGTIYRRTRTINGIARPIAEVRFDGLAGCLRTPSGGSSRQFLLFVDADCLRARALNPREALRLMGVDDAYTLPKSAAAALRVAGDGVAVPVVAWLSEHLLAPLVVPKRTA